MECSGLRLSNETHLKISNKLNRLWQYTFILFMSIPFAHIKAMHPHLMDEVCEIELVLRSIHQFRSVCLIVFKTHPYELIA